MSTRPIPLVVVMDDRLWRADPSSRKVDVEGWYDYETKEAYVVMKGLNARTAARGIAATYLHELIHAASPRATEKKVANAERVMMKWLW